MDYRPTEVDRSKFPPGPWDNEPDDYEEWQYMGYTCVVWRNSFGNWCGYVGIPPSHPYYGKHYDNDEVALDVHGGLTFSDTFFEGSTTWFLGFDCGHWNDLVPAMAGYVAFSSQAIYRTKSWTIEETKRLAEQLRRVASEEPTI